MVRWRAWLQGPATGRAADARDESKAKPTTQDHDTERVPPPSLDDVLRGAAQQRDPRDHDEVGKGGPNAG